MQSSVSCGKIPAMPNLPTDLLTFKDAAEAVSLRRNVKRRYTAETFRHAVKKNLMIFVTATIVDPAGNRVHSPDEMPFAQSTTPEQSEGNGVVKEVGSQKVSAAALAVKP